MAAETALLRPPASGPSFCLALVFTGHAAKVSVPPEQKLFLLETIFHKILLIKSFVLLTMELSVWTLATWHVTRPFLAVLWMFNTAPETSAFQPPAPSSQIPDAPSSSHTITSSAAR